MVLEAVVCKHCGQSANIQRFGKTSKGTQRYRCGDCKKTFVSSYTYKASDPEVKVQILKMAINGAGVRDTARILQISPTTVSNQLKKKSHPVTSKS